MFKINVVLYLIFIEIVLKTLEKFILVIESHYRVHVLSLSKVLRFFSSFNKRNESAQVMRKKKVRAYAFYKKDKRSFCSYCVI